MDAPSSSVGPYRLVRLLGKGGMGEVYEATTEKGAAVALKVFAVEKGAQRFLRERFEAEGRLLAKLRHPRLVTVYGSGVDAGTGRPYYAMALVRDGNGRPTTLHDVCAHGKVTEARAERWYRDLCDVLSYCHRKGVVHRDVKLGNVLLDAEDHAILSDFGVSRIVAPDLREEIKVATTFVTGETAGTRPVMGSYWYLAPEVRRGEAATFASDWYALGVLFFRLLTGMWYEPATDALELLAPYAPAWRRRLARLLDADPARRGLPPAERPRRLVISLIISLVASLVVVGLLSTPPPALPALPALPAPPPSPPPAPPPPPTPSVVTLRLDATNRFVFCPCPPGTNGYRKLSVAVTRPYWLGETPVTRRQYFAVTGEPLTAWEGGEDAPMTYVSREEVTNFCARLNARFAGDLPSGVEIRLPTLAEWRLAYAQGRTVPAAFPDKGAMRRACAERGWCGQEVGGGAKRAGMRRYYEGLGRPVPLVANIWKDFPPRVVNPGREDWMRRAAEVPPVPVGLKPANGLGLRDMLGNCAERAYDTCSAKCHHWGRTEWGVATTGLYAGQGSALTNPVERTGNLPLMVGSYLAPDLAGDRVWSADFDRLPHLGFRLCLGARMAAPSPPAL